MPVTPFAESMKRHGRVLTRGSATTLQINTGYLCNMACRHCHLEAGPARTEVMGREIMDLVADYARRCSFQLADVTGGAPEMVPDLDHLLRALSGAVPNLMLRSNLTAVGEQGRDRLLPLLKELKVALVCSFPSLSPAQAEAQRGKGVFDRSTDMLGRLNSMGWGVDESLQLHLVSNPSGAFMPPGQAAAEKRFKRELMRKSGIEFNNLFVFANVPLGRFKKWLELSGNLDGYMEKLAAGFNPCTVDGLMCRSLVSVDWEGYLHDCDFHLAAGIPIGGEKTHISHMGGPPQEGARIATADHCCACTAGSGFT